MAGNQKLSRKSARSMIDRRRFVSLGATSITVLVVASCRRSRAPAVTESEPAEVIASQPSPQAEPPAPPVERLSRAAFLEFLEQRATYNMQRCHHCAQASFLTLREGFGLPDSGILKALTPLPGIAERGETCGAVIGPLMAIGVLFGREQLGDLATWRASLRPARAFCARFEEAFGSTACGDLLESLFGQRYDLADPQEQAEFIAADPGPTEGCGRVVKTAVRLAAEEILNEQEIARRS